MKALLIDTHFLVPRSRSSAKVKVKYQGHVSQKMGVSGALVFHKHILAFFIVESLFCLRPVGYSNIVQISINNTMHVTAVHPYFNLPFYINHSGIYTEPTSMHIDIIRYYYISLLSIKKSCIP